MREIEIDIDNISSEHANLIWSNLDLNESLSNSTKENILTIVLSLIYSQAQEVGLENEAISVASVSSQIPDELKDALNYDILSANTSQRVLEIGKIREDCKDGELVDLELICDPILATEYDVLMSNLENMSAESEGMDVPEVITDSLQSISTLEKLEDYIEDKTSGSRTFLTFYFILMFFSILTYYAHFKIFNRELIFLHIPYYISKVNLIQFVPTYNILLILTLFLTSGKLLDALSGVVGPEISQMILPIIPNLEIYGVMISILNKTLLLSTYYLIISIIIYVGFLFILKKKVENYESFEE